MTVTTTKRKKTTTAKRKTVIEPSTILPPEAFEARDIPHHLLDPSLDNVREEVTHDDAIDDLAASIAKHGVQQSLVVHPHPDQPDRFVIIMGHRRHYAAGLLNQPPLMPCRIRPPYTSRGQLLAAMVTENRHRKEISAVEEGRAFENMALDGMSDEDIAEATSTREAQVKERRKLTGLRREHQSLVHTGQLAIEHGLALIEFADDAKASTEIDRAIEQGTPADIRNAIALARARRDTARIAARTTAALRKAGIQIEARSPLYTRWDSEYRLGASNRLPATREEHESTGCKHMAAYLPLNGSMEHVSYVCLDPTQHGLPMPGQTDVISHLDQEEAEAAAQDRAARQELAYEEAGAGLVLRQEYLRSLIQGSIAMTDEMAAAVSAYLVRLMITVEVQPNSYLLARFIGLDEEATLVLQSGASSDFDQIEAEEKHVADAVAALPSARGLLAVAAADAETERPDLRWYQRSTSWLSLLGGPLGHEWTQWEAEQISATQPQSAAHEGT